MHLYSRYITKDSCMDMTLHEFTLVDEVNTEEKKRMHDIKILANTNKLLIIITNHFQFILSYNRKTLNIKINIKFF